MTLLEQWNLTLVLLAQSVSGLTSVMTLLSSFGTENFFLLAVPALYWCIDTTLGVRLVALLLASQGLNGVFKIAFHLPRPYWVDARVQALSLEPTYGLPSGHAMNSTTLWGFGAAQLKKRWAWGLAFAIILLISLSRLYLGMHFPGDVLAGWALGGILLWGFLHFERPVGNWLNRLARPAQAGIVLTLSVGYLALNLGWLWILDATSSDPAGWQTIARTTVTAQNPGQVIAAEAYFAPRAPEPFFTVAGMLLGFGLALVFGAKRFTFFNAGGPILQRALRFLLGLIGVLVFWLGLKFLTPPDPLWLNLGLRYVRYALAVFWIFYLAPMVFVKLKLVKT